MPYSLGSGGHELTHKTGEQGQEAPDAPSNAILDRTRDVAKESAARLDEAERKCEDIKLQVVSPPCKHEPWDLPRRW